MSAEPASPDFHRIAAGLTLPSRAFIDGEWRAARSGAVFETLNPATGAVLGTVAHCGTEDVDLAVRAARRAFEEGNWSRAAPEHRKEVLLRLAALVREHAQDLAALESLDSGKTITEMERKRWTSTCRPRPSGSTSASLMPEPRAGRSGAETEGEDIRLRSLARSRSSSATA